MNAICSKLPSQLIARAAVFKVLGHPSRLLMIEALRDRELCVSELTGLVGADVSTVSKHLALMKTTGLVASEKRGLHIYYRLLDRQIGDPANHPGNPSTGQLAG